MKTNKAQICSDSDNEDLIAMLTALSVASKRLARTLIRISLKEQKNENKE